MQTAGEGFEHINDPDAVWVTPGLGKAVGDSIRLLINDHARQYMVRGLIPNSAQMGTEAILMDIGAAQLVTGKSGRVDRILIKVPDANNFDLWQSKLQQALPAGVLLNAQGTETAANRRMLAAFRWNLPMLSGIALLVGAFLIYNAVSVSVVRRRSDIGIMRALGASRAAVMVAFLFEAALYRDSRLAGCLPIGPRARRGSRGHAFNHSQCALCLQPARRHDPFRGFRDPCLRRRHWRGTSLGVGARTGSRHGSADRGNGTRTARI